VLAADPSDPVSSLERIVNGSQDNAYQVVYNVTANGPSTEKSVEYTETYYRKGDWQRIDIVDKRKAGQSISTRVYFNRKDADFTACTQAPGQEWDCHRLTGSGALQVADSSMFFIFDPASGFVKALVEDPSSRGAGLEQRENREVAGQIGHTYVLYAAPPQQGYVEFVVTDDGLLLSVDSRAGNMSQDAAVEAVEIRGEVPDDAFKPPVTPSDAMSLSSL
jgi:hypothetical protein